MEISKILTADILDIVFEGKNKEYGAYELRKSYIGRLRVAITVTGSVVLLCVAGFLFADQHKLATLTTFDIPDQKLTKLEDEKVIQPPVIPPPPVKQPEVMERRNLTIVVVPDPMVPPDEII